MSSWVGEGVPPFSSLKKDSLLLGRPLTDQEEEDEEELIFDHTSLLNRRQISIENGKRSLCTRMFNYLRCCCPSSVGSHLQVARTFNLCLSFFALGLCFAIPTATLDDLQKSVDAGQEVKNIYTARYSGYLFGALIGGFLFDRYNRQFLLFLSLLATGVGILVMPFCRALAGLMACTAITGITMGFLDTGGNVWCLDLWGRRSGPIMQGMHFCFGLGAFLAPLVAEPFLTPHANLPLDVINIRNIGGAHMIHLGIRNGSSQLHVPSVGLPHTALGGAHRNHVQPKEHVLVKGEPFFIRHRRNQDSSDVTSLNFLNQTSNDKMILESKLVITNESYHKVLKEDDFNSTTSFVNTSAILSSSSTSTPVSTTDEMVKKKLKPMYADGNQLKKPDFWDNRKPKKDHEGNIITSAPPINTTAKPGTTIQTTTSTVFKSDEPPSVNATEKNITESSLEMNSDFGNFTLSAADFENETDSVNLTLAKEDIHDQKSTVPENISSVLPASLSSGLNCTSCLETPKKTNLSVSSTAVWSTVKSTSGKSSNTTPIDEKHDSVPLSTNTSSTTTTTSPASTDLTLKTTPLILTTTSSPSTTAVTSFSTILTTSAAPDNMSVSTANNTNTISTTTITTSILTIISTSTSKPTTIPSSLTDSMNSTTIIAAGNSNSTQDNYNSSASSITSGKSNNALLTTTQLPKSSTRNATPVSNVSLNRVPSKGFSANESDTDVALNSSRKKPLFLSRSENSHNTNTSTSNPDQPNTASDKKLLSKGLRHEQEFDSTTLPVPENPKSFSTTDNSYLNKQTNLDELQQSKIAEPITNLESLTETHESNTGQNQGIFTDDEELISQNSFNEKGEEVLEEDSNDELKKETNRSGQTAEDSNTESSSQNTTEENSKKSRDIFSRIFDLINQNKLGRFEIPYILLSIYIFIVAVVFLVFLCRNPRELRSKQDEELDHSWQPSVSFRMPMVSLMVLFFCLYVGMEVAVGELLETFATKEDLQLSRARGYFLPHLFWGSFAVARGLSICVAMQFSGRCMLLTNLSICLVASIMLVAGADKLEALLWIGIVLLGLGMAPLFPTAISWIEGYLRVTNKMASVFILGAAVGEIVLPTVISVFINQEPMVLMYVNILVNALCFACFMVLCVIASRHTLKYAHKPSRTLYQLASTEDSEEMGTELVTTNAASPSNGHIPVRRKITQERQA